MNVAFSNESNNNNKSNGVRRGMEPGTGVVPRPNGGGCVSGDVGGEDGGEYLDGLADREKLQLEVFFRSLKTEVFICESLVNMYAFDKEGDSWTYKHTGVIVVILECGCTKSKTKRKIQILLAERGTCFPLWRDTIDNLTAYHKSNPAFHTMHLSSDHSQIVGFSFDSPLHGEKLHAHIQRLTSNPENINIFVPGSSKRGKNVPKKACGPLPQKKHISHPCLFQHVNSINVQDRPIYASLQTLIDGDSVNAKENVA